jgi:hypothetical protein
VGFYGSITNTSKTTFSFDIIYTTRSEMDKEVNRDGVFLGRYVLVDYDNDPIKAYYNTRDGLFYNTASFAKGTELVGRDGPIYQDLAAQQAIDSFYKYNESKSSFVKIYSSPYQESFNTDVAKYGRGYDSTVWVKRYDTSTNQYKYAMIAELNAVVPTFHMVNLEPSASALPPYFDKDTTNIDYYLHM